MVPLEIQTYAFVREESIQTLFNDALQSREGLVEAIGSVPGCRVVGHFSREFPITCFQDVFGLRTEDELRQIIANILTSGMAKVPEDMAPGDLVFYTDAETIRTVGDITHVARCVGNGIVRSKLGNMRFAVEHPFTLGPPKYGDKVVVVEFSGLHDTD